MIGNTNYLSIPTITEHISFFIVLLFLGLNIWILYIDTSKRKIPNTLLIGLCVILPSWLILFPTGNNQVLIAHSILSLGLILGGIFFYAEIKFLGSGDIKYGAILLLFLGAHSLPVYIGNIGVLTLAILIFWWSIILGQIYALRAYLGDIEKKIIIPKIRREELLKNITVFIGDWVIIGFFLSLAIKDISLQLFQIVVTDGDYYFLLSLLIFLMRPGFRYLLTKWQYRAYPMIGMFLYFGFSLQSRGGESLYLEFLSFITNIWQYILIFTLVNSVTRKTFSVYDSLMKRLEIVNLIHTIPYSIIIFGGFCLAYFLDINLIAILQKL